MKKVIFVCLLSFAVCLSQQAAVSGAAPQAAKASASDPNPTTKATEATPAVTPSQAPPAQAPPAGKDAQPAQNITEKATNTSFTPAPETKNSTANESANKTTDKKDVVPPAGTGKNETDVKTTVAPTQATKPDDGKKEATTQKSDATPSTKPTEAPHKADEPKTVQARGFDGTSFIGGIILTLGLLAIGFVGFKYYKNQTERNYHTL